MMRLSDAQSDSGIELPLTHLTLTRVPLLKPISASDLPKLALGMGLPCHSKVSSSNSCVLRKLKRAATYANNGTESGSTIALVVGARLRRDLQQLAQHVQIRSEGSCCTHPG